MSWPWSTIGLPDDATPAEIRSAHQSWREQNSAADSAAAAAIDRAFSVALEMAEERDPSHLHHSQFPDPWSDRDAANSATLPALRPDHPPQASADVLATALLGLARQAPDFEAFTVALSRLHAWRDAATRRGADGNLREWLVDGGDLPPLHVVRLSRVFDWTPSSPALQTPERDLEWRRLVKYAFDQVAPPDPAYTGSVGRGFLLVGTVAGIGLALLLLPRILAGGVRLLIPIVFAAACAWLLIRWRR
jgi:hypothetical protein